MRRYQKGEIILVMMAVMLAVGWIWNGRMGMMGHGADHDEKSASTVQQTKAEHPPTPTESPESQR